eukprot:TRINITY_DN6661_c0_g1_i1.p1 TRINITY_DN6661_c0_g1~~TRINITY_DN6661_c0_g1_i1.p1  ORF type:complete len:163 (-),score=45.54 TRINITY_DN6661_c0_g1_i1:69-557(-)
MKDTIQIFIRTNNKTIVMEVNKNNTVKELKEEIHKKKGKINDKDNEMRLTSSGKNLNDLHTMTDSRINNNTTIELHYAFKGGTKPFVIQNNKETEGIKIKKEISNSKFTYSTENHGDQDINNFDGSDIRLMMSLEVLGELSDKIMKKKNPWKKSSHHGTSKY